METKQERGAQLHWKLMVDQNVLIMFQITGLAWKVAQQVIITQSLSRENQKDEILQPRSTWNHIIYIQGDPSAHGKGYVDISSVSV